MKEVIRIDGLTPQEEKPVEFTHCMDEKNGWERSLLKPNVFEKIVYLGECDIDGDMFAVYDFGSIDIFKGHLNSGKY